MDPTVDVEKLKEMGFKVSFINQFPKSFRFSHLDYVEVELLDCFIRKLGRTGPVATCISLIISDSDSEFSPIVATPCRVFSLNDSKYKIPFSSSSLINIPSTVHVPLSDSRI